MEKDAEMLQVASHDDVDNCTVPPRQQKSSASV